MGPTQERRGKAGGRSARTRKRTFRTSTEKRAEMALAEADFCGAARAQAIKEGMSAGRADVAVAAEGGSPPVARRTVIESRAKPDA